MSSDITYLTREEFNKLYDSLHPVLDRLGDEVPYFLLFPLEGGKKHSSVGSIVRVRSKQVESLPTAVVLSFFLTIIPPEADKALGLAGLRTALERLAAVLKVPIREYLEVLREYENEQRG